MVYFLCKAYDSDRQNCYFAQSLPVRGAWIEIRNPISTPPQAARRSPCGERGLKCDAIAAEDEELASLPVRGAWIEITSYIMRAIWIVRRSPCGERGLKSNP